MKYLFTFHTHSQAIKFRRELKKESIDVTLKPVPRKLSSSCGVAAELTYNGEINKFFTSSIEAIYEMDETGFKNIYNNN